jgi:hypothetical protein
MSIEEFRTVIGQALEFREQSGRPFIIVSYALIDNDPASTIQIVLEYERG